MPEASSGPWTSVGSARLLSEAFEMFSTPEERRNLARKRPCLSCSFIARGLGALFFAATATLGFQVQPFAMSPGDASVPGAGAAVCICDVAPWSFSLEAAAVFSDHGFLCHSINVLLLFLTPNIFK